MTDDEIVSSIIAGSICVLLAISTILIYVFVAKEIALFDETSSPSKEALWISSRIPIGCASLAGGAAVLGTLLLPLDVAMYPKGRVALNDAIRYSWNSLYWLTFVLAWIVLPISSAIFRSERFGVKRRVVHAVTGEAKFYVLGFLVAMIFFFVVYVSGKVTIMTDKVVPVVMAVGNAYGLALVVACLGRGLVRVPLYLWRCNDSHDRVKRLENDASQQYERYMTRVANLRGILRTTNHLAEMTDHDESKGVMTMIDAMRRRCVHVKHIVNDHLEPLPDRSTTRREWGMLPVQAKHERLRRRNRELKDALSAFYQAKGQFTSTTRSWALSHKFDDDRVCKNKTLEQLQIIETPYTLCASRILACMCVLLSCVCIVDEATVVIPFETSIFGFLIRANHDEKDRDVDDGVVLIALFSFGMYAYVCISCYLSYLGASIPGVTAGARIYFNRLTQIPDLLSLFAAVARMQFALGYHFLMTLGAEKKHPGELLSTSFKELYDMSTNDIANWFFSVFPILCIVVTVFSIVRECRDKRLRRDRVDSDVRRARLLLFAEALRAGYFTNKSRRREDKEASLLTDTSSNTLDRVVVGVMTFPTSEYVRISDPIDLTDHEEEKDDDTTKNMMRSSVDKAVVQDVDESCPISEYVRISDPIDLKDHEEEKDDDTTKHVVRSSDDTAIMRDVEESYTTENETSRSPQTTSMAGWVSKRSDTMKRFRRRFFRFSENVLSYYLDSSPSAKCRNSWTLNTSCKIESRLHFVSIRRPEKHALAVKVPQKRLKIYIVFDSALDALRWWRVLAPACGVDIPERVRTAAREYAQRASWHSEGM